MPRPRQLLLVDDLLRQLAAVSNDALIFLVQAANGNDEDIDRRDEIIDSLADMLSCVYCKDYEYIDGGVVWVDENTGDDQPVVGGAAEGSPP